jgi:hypothetical protein
MINLITVYFLCLIRLMNSKVQLLDLGYIMLNLIFICLYVVMGLLSQYDLLLY